MLIYMFKMIRYLAFICILPASLAVAEGIYLNPQNIKTTHIEQSFVREGWHIFAIAEGDLNQDGIPDFAVIVEADEAKRHYVNRFRIAETPPYIGAEYDDEWTSLRALRKLMIILQGTHNSIEHVFTHDAMIDRGDFGGTIDEPIQSLEINRGSIVIQSLSGSKVQTKLAMRIRQAGKKWRVIGLTNIYNNLATNDKTKQDHNLLNHKTKIDEFKNDELVKTYWTVTPQDLTLYLNSSVE